MSKPRRTGKIPSRRSASNVLWRVCLPVCLPMTVMFSRVAAAQDEVDQKRTWAVTEAIALWLGLAILAVLILGIGLMWGVSRWAKWVMKKREPTHTEMKNIWYLNPPEKRQQDKP